MRIFAFKSPDGLTYIDLDHVLEVSGMLPFTGRSGPGFSYRLAFVNELQVMSTYIPEFDRCYTKKEQLEKVSQHRSQIEELITEYRRFLKEWNHGDDRIFQYVDFDTLYP